MDPECPFARTDHDRLADVERRVGTQGALLFLLMFLVVYGGFILVVRAGFLKGAGAHG